MRRGPLVGMLAYFSFFTEKRGAGPVSIKVVSKLYGRATQLEACLCSDRAPELWLVRLKCLYTLSFNFSSHNLRQFQPDTLDAVQL